MNILDIVARAVSPPRPEDAFVSLCRAICAAAGKRFGTPGQIAELTRAQKLYDTALAQIEAHTHLRAREAWLSHRAELDTAAAGGALADVEALSRARIEESYETKMEAGKRARLAAAVSVKKTACELAEEFAKVATAFAEDQQRAEADNYKKFGVPNPGPSALVKALLNAGAEARQRAAVEGFGRPPREVCPYVRI